MTTNKPEVLAYHINKQNPEHRGVTLEPLVRLSDYEALKAECEQLRKDAERYRWLMERGDDFQWENIIRLDIEDFPSRCAAIDAAMEEENK